MKSKLTLTLDAQVIISAKKYAKQNGKSLSGIIGSYLTVITAKVDVEDLELPQKISVD